MKKNNVLKLAMLSFKILRVENVTRSIIYKKRLIRNTSPVNFRNKERSLKTTSQIKNLRNATI